YRSRCGDAVFVFFPSRRRHTRSTRDWSSDVCSSDLVIEIGDTPQIVTTGNMCATCSRMHVPYAEVVAIEVAPFPHPYTPRPGEIDEPQRPPRDRRRDRP